MPISRIGTDGIENGAVAPADLSTGGPYWDGSGNVGVGTSSPSALRMTIESSGGQLRIRNSSTRYRSDWVVGSAGDTEINSYDDTGSVYRPLRLDANPLIFNVSGTERARIDSSGNFLVGTTSSATNGVGPGFQVQYANGAGSFINIGHPSSAGSGYSYAIFSYNNGIIGSIGQNGTTGVTYSTSSDYRLKENVQPMTGALAKVAVLKPCTYTWKVDGSDGQGFIAHELAEVVPDAVTGEKDAVDAEGNIVPQGIDTSFLVATLTAAIQELNAKVEAQAAEIAALKGAA